jgi:LysM repeat protein
MIALLLWAPLALMTQAPTVPARAAAWAPRLQEAFKDRNAVVPLLIDAGSALAALEGKERQLLGDSLEPLLQRVYFSPERFPGDEQLGITLHEVKRGDTGGRIGERHRFGHGLLAKWNTKYDERRLAVGQKLKVVHFERKEVEIVVDRAIFRLSAWRTVQGKTRVPLLFTAVGVGASDSPTPEGLTQVVERVKNPSWTHPTTKVTYAHGDPRNILGGIWIELDSQPFGRTGIGLHGYTGAPTKDWLEQPGSHGCVRLQKTDCERVFQLALEGTAVRLR